MQRGRRGRHLPRRPHDRRDSRQSIPPLLQRETAPASSAAPPRPRVLVAVFTYIFLANAWLGDDAYITFRVVWNLLHGYGPCSIPVSASRPTRIRFGCSRSRAAHVVTREFFFTALAVSYGFALAAVLVVGAQRPRPPPAWPSPFVWLLSSKAFVDYTSSGLEYPLSYLPARTLLRALLPDLGRAAHVLGAATVRAARRAGVRQSHRQRHAVCGAAGLARAARACAGATSGCFRSSSAFAVPAAAWLVFATIYYGFPLPNTYYAKVATGIPASLLHRQGLAYLFNSFAHDPVTLAPRSALAAPGRPRLGTAARCATASALLYVALHDLRRRRLHERPLLRDAVPGRRHRA